MQPLLGAFLRRDPAGAVVGRGEGRWIGNAIKVLTCMEAVGEDALRRGSQIEEATPVSGSGFLRVVSVE